MVNQLLTHYFKKHIMVVTRFAPSPTGFLHIGAARTALFNWLYAAHHGGKFLIRIEDTDIKRSTQEAIKAIYKGLEWLGLNSPHPTYLQTLQAPRHREVALELLKRDKAYKCYCTSEEVEAMRAEARAAGKPMRYNGKCRYRQDQPLDHPYVVRLKAPQEGRTIIPDLVQGEVIVDNSQLDDMVLLRSDGTPTYMLAVVVDDHDMGITHVIRGDDHLTNAFRQYQIYTAMGWEIPRFAHIPLIHGSDGKKLSKRHGALGVDAYQEQGFLPEAIFNYLLRLGWGHGDEEIISQVQAIEWFDLPGVGQSPARFDWDKLLHLNAHYIKHIPDATLTGLTVPFLEKLLNKPMSVEQKQLLEQAMAGLKTRAKTLVEMADMAAFYFKPRPLPLDEKAQALLCEATKNTLSLFVKEVESLADWSHTGLETVARAFCTAQEMKLGHLAQPLRAALTGALISPGIFEVMEVLGREESLARIRDYCQYRGV